eukprot:c9223_g1_i1.p1 GENE.c9223_g1_i1~~c9223_g1_i1.p1  ORF type:complete len:428 (-),score=100.83 c9223_g1_i1:364-1647(-)
MGADASTQQEPTKKMSGMTRAAKLASTRSFSAIHKTNSVVMSRGSLLRQNFPLSVPEFRDGRYHNPSHWGTWKDESLWIAIQVTLERFFHSYAKKADLDRDMPVIKPCTKMISTPPAPGAVRATWLGQSTFLLQMGSLNLLTDPVFGDRTWRFGHTRLRPVALELSELPPIHAILISHSHHDHLDAEVVAHFKDTVQWFVPEGLRRFFSDAGVSRVCEMTWWDTAKLTLPSSVTTQNSNSNSNSAPTTGSPASTSSVSDSVTNQTVEIVCVPAQHHTQRTPSDKNTSLWCGYVINYSDPHVTTHAHANANVSAQPKKVCFVGDTGYSPVFREIGRELGPIDVSLIPVGAYEPLEHMRPQHCSPEDAVRIHTDLQSKFSFGMHWGTFQYSHEDVFEPPKRLAQAVATQLPPHAKDTFVCMPHGSTFEK